MSSRDNEHFLQCRILHANIFAILASLIILTFFFNSLFLDFSPSVIFWILLLKILQALHYCKLVCKFEIPCKLFGGLIPIFELIRYRTIIAACLWVVLFIFVEYGVTLTRLMYVSCCIHLWYCLLWLNCPHRSMPWCVNVYSFFR